jgi:hypothetical protein
MGLLERTSERVPARGDRVYGLVREDEFGGCVVRDKHVDDVAVGCPLPAALDGPVSGGEGLPWPSRDRGPGWG